MGFDLLLRYAITGVASYIVYNMMLLLLFSYGHSAKVASFLSYGIAVVANFCLSRWYTFRALNHSVSNHLLRFILLTMFNAFLMISANSFLVDDIGYDLIIVNNIALLLTIVVGFFANNFIIFKKSHRRD